MRRYPDSAVAALERQFAAQFDSADAVATGFGRAALRLALEAANAAGREVLLPDFICKQMLEAVHAAGAAPKFLPVPRDLNIPVDQVNERFASRTAAVVVPHYFGRVQPQTAAISRWCAERGVTLIEDCAQALGAAGAGGHGDFSVFSFTKTDWCYGGGMVTCRRAADATRLRAYRDREFRAAPTLLAKYGLLTRLDFAANRPSRSRAAERAGPVLGRMAGLGCENFYDAGRMDATLSVMGARRATRILRAFENHTSRRAKIVQALMACLAVVPHAVFRAPQAGDSHAYLLLQSSAASAEHWVREARDAGVTLRRAWPAFDEPAPGQASANLAWFADHLVILEVHPRLNPGEVVRIAECVKRLAGRE